MARGRDAVIRCSESPGVERHFDDPGGPSKWRSDFDQVPERAAGLRAIAATADIVTERREGAVAHHHRLPNISPFGPERSALWSGDGAVRASRTTPDREDRDGDVASPIAAAAAHPGAHRDDAAATACPALRPHRIYAPGSTAPCSPTISQPQFSLPSAISGRALRWQLGEQAAWHLGCIWTVQNGSISAFQDGSVSVEMTAFG